MHYLTATETAELNQGIRTFNHLIGLLHDPLYGRFTAEEQDLIAALESVKSAVEESRRMLGLQKYQGMAFDVIRAVKADMTSFLLNGNDERHKMYMSKRNMPMYILVVEPTIDALSSYTHEEVLNVAPNLVDEVIQLVCSSTDYGDMDDAKVAQQLVRDLIAEQEAAAKVIRDAKRRPRKRKQDSLLDLFQLTETESDDFE